CSRGQGPRSSQVAAIPVLVKGIKPPRWISNLTVTRSKDLGDGKDDLKLDWTNPTTDIYGKPETLSQVRIYHATTGPQFPLDAGPRLVPLGPPVKTSTPEAAFWDASKTYSLAVTVDNEGNVSGGGHELPRGIDDLLIAKAGSNLQFSWGPITLDLDGRYNPA